MTPREELMALRRMVELEAKASPAGARTHDGLPARHNADGSYSTEVSITVTNPRLNGGRPTNIPSLWGGQEVDEDTAVNNALASRKPYDSFNTVDEAVQAARARSASGGAASAPMTANIPGTGGMPLPGSGGETPEAEPSFLDRVMADIKSIPRMTGRALLDVGAGVTEGVAALPAMIPDFAVRGYNMATDSNVAVPSEELSRRLAEIAPAGAGGPIRTAAAAVGGTAFNPAAAIPRTTPANFRGDLTSRTGAQEVAEKGANMGLKVNPADPNLKPNLGTRALGVLSNRPKVEDMLSRSNQAPITAAVSRGGELAPGEPLTREMMAAGRDRIGQIYDQVRKAGPLVADEPMIEAQANPSVARLIKARLGSLENATADDAVTAWQRLRDEASAGYNAVGATASNRTVNRQNAANAEAAADALKAWIDRGLRSQGKGPLADEFLTAPQRIAQSHTLTDAVIPGAKAADISVLARALNKDVPLRGEPKTLAEFGTIFPQVSRSPISAAPSGAGAAAAAEGNIGAAAMSQAMGGSPAAAGASGGRALSVTGIPAIARALLMRESLQRKATGQAPMPNELAEMLKEFRLYTGANAGVNRKENK